jgi:hypothetical protein
MVWSFIRIAIFTASFLTGLFVFDANDQPAAAEKVVARRSSHGFVEVKCDNHFSFAVRRPLNRVGQATRM